MKLYWLQTILVILASANFCKGQPGTVTAGQPKIVKTQGTNEYANVHCGLQDRAGNLWFGTTGEGVYRYDGKSFTNFTKNDGLADNNVWCMYEDISGTIWFGTNGGLCRYDPSVSPLPASKQFSTVAILASADNAPSEKEVWSILQDKTGNFWIGTNHGIYRYDGKLFTRFLLNDSVVNNSALHLRHIQSIMEDSAGHIWFASWNREGVARYDGRSIIRYSRKEGLTDDMIHSLLQDKNSNIWAGARNGGVYRYNGTGFEHFTDENSLGNTCIYTMHEDLAGNIWFATERSGVWRYDPSASTEAGSKAFTNFTTKDGLSNNSVCSIVEDSSGRLWFGTRGIGLSSYDGKIFANFTD